MSLKFSAAESKVVSSPPVPHRVSCTSVLRWERVPIREQTVPLTLHLRVQRFLFTCRKKIKAEIVLLCSTDHPSLLWRQLDLGLFTHVSCRTERLRLAGCISQKPTLASGFPFPESFAVPGFRVWFEYSAAQTCREQQCSSACCSARSAAEHKASSKEQQNKAPFWKSVDTSV